MAFTRTHYEQIASILKSRKTASNHSEIFGIASDLAAMFVIDNPRFNRVLFLKACGFNAGPRG